MHVVVFRSDAQLADMPGCRMFGKGASTMQLAEIKFDRKMKARHAMVILRSDGRSTKGRARSDAGNKKDEGETCDGDFEERRMFDRGASTKRRRQQKRMKARHAMVILMSDGCSTKGRARGDAASDIKMMTRHAMVVWRSDGQLADIDMPGKQGDAACKDAWLCFEE